VRAAGKSAARSILEVSMALDRTNIVVCPSCGAENIEGAVECSNCQADLRSLDVPESAQVASESDLTKPISSIRLSKPSVVTPESSVRDAISFMRQETIGAVVVAAEGTIVGIFTERDVLKKVAADGAALDSPVSAYMTPDPVVLRDDDMMAYALNKMGDGGFRHIPVTKDGQLVAIVTARDVMSWVLGRYFD
jgi:CBS domain-containing protein/ribosomal protein L40E